MLKTKTGSIATSTGNVALGLTGDSVCLVSLYGTHSGFKVVFEGTLDGTHWITLNALSSRNNVNHNPNVALVTNASRSFFIFCGFYSQLRVRATARSSGTLNVVMTQNPAKVPDLSGVSQSYFGLNTGKVSGVVAAGSGTANVVVTSSPCIVHSLIVTTAGTASLQLFDNASTNSGTNIWSSAATFALGTKVDLNMVCANGLTAAQANGSAAVAISYTPL